MQTDTPPQDVSAVGIRFSWFLAYKFLNSLFLGLSIGTVFVVYSPLSPAVFSAGGIGLALGTLLIATQYHRLFNVIWFYRISLLVELVILAGITGVLIYPIEETLALFVYLGYQLTFAFGSYLVRCETQLIPEKNRLTQLDVAKQIGYLAGMGISWGIYEALEALWEVVERTEQVTLMHRPLFILEVLVIVALIGAFKRRHH